ncbi:MAG: 5'-nucleotidase, lipoprotein e(P4) family [Bacteroidales bacterium]|jgi:5'-nucleotidase (lipoprotein e(P4) family)|nr:5'-nucleotidase, lipoprotein e(P4) family [Bacteroidales bacterium]
MKKFVAITFLVILASCGSTKTGTVTTEESQDQLILSTLWYQKSAEMRALYYQCFRNAKIALDDNLAAYDKSKPAAVVLDIDETILDNSPFQGWQVHAMKGYSTEEWTRWVNEARARALPGALEFTRYADSIGVELFYISNRDQEDLGPTIENLADAGFPSSDSTHLLLRGQTSSKTERRNSVGRDFEILLFIGDNLADMADKYERRGEDHGFGVVDSEKDLFGTRYIVLPNPMYGNWLNELMKKAEGATTREKLVRLLEGF